MKNKILEKMDNQRNDYLRVEILIKMMKKKDNDILIKDIFPEISKKEYFKVLAPYFFDYFLLYISIFIEETFYLLDNGFINIKTLVSNEIETIIYSSDEGIDKIIELLDKLNLDNPKIIVVLARFVITYRKNKFSKLLNVLMNTGNYNAIHRFFSELLEHDEEFDYNLMLEALEYGKTDVQQNNYSILPHTLVEHMYRGQNLRNFIVENFDELFEAEKNKKMTVYQSMQKYLPPHVNLKYNYLIKLYFASTVPPAIERSLNILLEHHEEDYVRNFIGNEEVEFKGSGSTSQVFRVGNKVLKICKMKHNAATLTKHFLLAPTEMKVIYNAQGKPLLYVEKQDLLSQSFDEQPITKEDIDNYFLELKKCGLILNDPHCVKRMHDNFGFLNDYHDATLVGVDSYEELPDWFKKRPLVLFDIDMVIEKRNIKKRKR